MEKTEVRWVLAFDASCAKCRQLSARMASSCDGKLEVLPLAHQEVVRWREEAFGSQTVWEPALFSVDGEKVRGWTGRAMGVPLVRRLGLGSTLSVLRALGQLREVAGSPTDEVTSAPPGAVNRKRFLQLGTGALVAGGLMVTGKLPAYASADKAGAWVAANAGNLPSTYDAITAHTMEYRKAIYQTLTPSAKSKLWVEQLARFRSAHHQLTAAQVKVLDSAAAAVANPATFATVASTSTLSPSEARGVGAPRGRVAAEPGLPPSVGTLVRSSPGLRRLIGSRGESMTQTLPSSTVDGPPAHTSMGLKTAAGMRVARRNGTVADFDPGRIAVAISKAFLAVQGDSAGRSSRLRAEVTDTTDAVTTTLARRYGHTDRPVDLEEVQDQVELALMRGGHAAVARSYILYREEHRKARADRDAGAGTADMAAPSISVVAVDGSRAPLDELRLTGVITEACHGLPDVSADAVLAGARDN